MRAAVYSGTRNLYPHMVPAMKSLIANSSVDKIYLLIEDEKFPETLPSLIETIDVSGQKWFPPDGPNMTNQFTYMALIRACYCKLLPEDLKTVLQLDVDTICVDNIDELWNMKLGRKWFAACDEPYNTYWRPYGVYYYNVGVSLWNLAEIRKSQADDEVIRLLNTEAFPFAEQDAWGKLGYPRKIADMPHRFNECKPCGYSDNPAIVHYAGWKHWWDDPQTPRREYYAKYRDMSWKEALACRES